MSDHIDDGSWVFPQPIQSSDGLQGMTLRDYLAAKVLNGLMANSEIGRALVKAKQNMSVDEIMAFELDICPRVFSKASYAYADAMIAVKNGGEA